MQNKLLGEKKSMATYIPVGMDIAGFSGDKPMDLIREVAAIEGAMMIIDDILDNSQTRGGHVAYHIEKGLNRAVIDAHLKSAEAQQALFRLMTKAGTNLEYQQKVLQTFTTFQRMIYEGQSTDNVLELQEYNSSMIQNYMQMITAFTGGHVRYSIEIGQLLCNKDPDPIVSEAAQALGVIRQIVDDYQDYSNGPHEPFGDFMRGIKRLPELLFYEQGLDRLHALELITQEKHDQAREYILTEQSRRQIYQICENQLEIVQRADGALPWQDLLIPYDEIAPTCKQLMKQS